MYPHSHTADLVHLVGGLRKCAKAAGYGEVENIPHKDRIRNHHRDRGLSDGNRVERISNLDK